MPSPNAHLHIGSLIFPDLDQTDFTAPFEILSRIPDSTAHVLWKNTHPLRDVRGLILTPEETLDDCPQLDVLHIPGGSGQQASCTMSKFSPSSVAKLPAQSTFFPSAPAP